MPPCDVPLCLSASSSVSRSGNFCAIHQTARYAKSLGISGDREGKGAQRCANCRRKFKDTDYVERQPVHKKGKRKGQPTTFLYHHIHCEPATSRVTKKAIRDTPKPLFVDLES